jgi:hypothetical protein
MPDEHHLTVRQVGQARADFAAIEAELDFIKFRGQNITQG